VFLVYFYALYFASHLKRPKTIVNRFDRYVIILCYRADAHKRCAPLAFVTMPPSFFMIGINQQIKKHRFDVRFAIVLPLPERAI
jgi:hypothetical protein